MTNGLFLLLSVGILGGVISAVLLKKARTPQVLGYILAGLIIGQSGLKFVTLKDIAMLDTFNMFALALIGFLVGSEIKIEDMKKHGKQFSAILFGEGLGAFFLVSILTGGVLYYVTGSMIYALAGGVVFGAISSATDPASTMSVLWENRSAGILTSTIIAVIVLDDALAMSLYGVASGLSQLLANGSTDAIIPEITKIAVELFGGVIVGGILGFITSKLLTMFHSNEHVLTASFGIFILGIAISIMIGFDLIIVSMTAGVVIANMTPIRSKKFVDYMRGLANPVYVFFFVLIGARLTIGSMPSWMWILVALFVLGRSLGKVSGAYLGARVSKAGTVVRKYTGLGLFSQGGVAIGLSIMAGHHLNGIEIADGFSLGDVIVSTIAATTFFIQIIGPPAVKLATKLSKEAGVDITIDDLIKSRSVGDIIEKDPSFKVLYENTNITDTVELFSDENSSFLPVISKENNILGMVTFENLRQLLSDPSLWEWSLVADIMSENVAFVSPDDSLDSAIKLAHSINYKQIPVVKDKKLIAVINIDNINKNLRNELMKKQDAAYAT